jgi:hypothetical protein
LVRSQRRPVAVSGQKKGALTNVDYSRKRWSLQDRRNDR